MASSPFHAEEHDAFRRTLARFVEKEVAPFVDAWDEAGEFPRALYGKAGAVGLLGLGFPEELGGTAGDGFMHIVAAEELARCGSGGVVAGLSSHAIALPPIVAIGSETLKRRVVPAVLAGDKIAALAVTEPAAGSDVANLQTTAHRDGNDYLVRGTKTFITSGMRADFYTVAVRTGGEGISGLSLLLIERERPGISCTPLRKMGWWASDTATIHFDDCRVPAENLIGHENQGFAGIVQNFNRERLGISAMAYGFSRVCLAQAIEYARERETFGKPLAQRQVIRHKIVDMATRIGALQAWLERLTWAIDRDQWPVADVCMLKNFATQTLELCAKEAVQIHGGAGYMRGTIVERIYRETKVLSIGGGAEEIMKDLAARQMGI